MRFQWVLRASLMFLLGASGACSDSQEVVVYCALDRNYSEPILKEFEKRTGIRVRAQYDAEATKSIGLRRALEEEASRPRCDVFWNNEILNTIALKQQGLLDTFRPMAAEGMPATFVDEDGQWFGFAARARVLIVNTQLLPDPKDWPTSYRDLLDPKWKGKAALAKPVAGTTLTHAAAWFTRLGEEGTWNYIDGLFANEVIFTAGNAASMRVVREGKAAFGFTDTDDFNEAKLGSYPVAAVYPDNGPAGLGTLLIPNTVSIVKGAPHRAQAERLMEFLLSEWVETTLARSSSVQIPLRPGIEAPSSVKMPSEFKVMDVDWEHVADAFKAHEAALAKRFVAGS
ncbi:MAG: extracellular solute-binding protein [Planctomycetes bacterium]|nr:extracellular solute-binding protein [Planctomycetota bacterium]